ncbi:hypothetical protein OG395_45160 [Streptomyces sp. NBC_01320]|nr:hypothetical protein OG395_45160 [Streptomyces sp. NBC_01320]
MLTLYKIPGRDCAICSADGASDTAEYQVWSTPSPAASAATTPGPAGASARPKSSAFIAHGFGAPAVRTA